MQGEGALDRVFGVLDPVTGKVAPIPSIHLVEYRRDRSLVTVEPREV